MTLRCEDVVEKTFEWEVDEGMDSAYTLGDIWKSRNTQNMQDSYARLTGISIWVLDEENQLISDRSLAAELSPRLLTYIDERMSTLNPSKNYVQDMYENTELLMKKRELYDEGRLLGASVFVQLVDNCTEQMKEAFIQQADFLIEVIQNMIGTNSKLWMLTKELEKTQEDEQKIIEEKKRLQHENDYDELTQVHSRGYFYRCMDEVEKNKDALPVSVIVGDVNNLKFTNDMFGHRHGDWLLYTVAKILKEEAENVTKQTGNQIIVARCGGDEFGILMLNAKRAVANYFCYRVTERLKMESGCCLPPSISLGSAKKSEMDQNLYRLMETADAKMYSVKREFKQNLDHFEEMMEILFARNFLSRCGMEWKMQLMHKFGVYMEWKEERIDKCRKLVRYQDIGLTIVPKQAYQRSNSYSDMHWREIKKHPQLGMKLALIRPDIAPISDMMYQTHENYDGSGWPKGIGGSFIIPEVVAVRLVTEYVDYAERYNRDRAYQYIEMYKGIIFEPDMAEQFLRFLDEMC